MLLGPLQVVFNYWTSKLQDLPENEEMVSGDQIAFALLKWLEELLGCDASEDGGKVGELPRTAVGRSGFSSNHLVMLVFPAAEMETHRDQATTVELPATTRRVGKCRNRGTRCRMRD